MIFLSYVILCDTICNISSADSAFSIGHCDASSSTSTLCEINASISTSTAYLNHNDASTSTFTTDLCDASTQTQNELYIPSQLENELREKLDFLLLSPDVLKENSNLLKFYTGMLTGI